jgi:Uma2 family endonuclease
MVKMYWEDTAGRIGRDYAWPVALTLGDHPVRPLTAHEMDRMVASGILGEDERVELLDGMLVQLSPKGPEHGAVMARLVRWLAPLLVAGTHSLRTEHPLRVPDERSLPEPDLVLVEGDPPTEHPTTAVMVIEVSVTSREIDTTIKPVLYASAGVPDHWVIDVPGRRIETRRDPGADGYRTLDVIEPGGHGEGLAPDLPPLALDGLLAGL